MFSFRSRPVCHVIVGLAAFLSCTGLAAAYDVDTEVRAAPAPFTVPAPNQNAVLDCRFDMKVQGPPQNGRSIDLQDVEARYTFIAEADGRISARVESPDLVHLARLKPGGGLDGVPMEEDGTPLTGRQLNLSLAAWDSISPEGFYGREINAGTMLELARHRALVDQILDAFWSEPAGAALLDHIGTPVLQRMVRGLIEVDGRELVIVRTVHEREDVLRKGGQVDSFYGVVVIDDGYELETGLPMLQVEQGQIYAKATRDGEAKHGLVAYHTTRIHCAPSGPARE
nr:hypothetical protein [uncultured Tistrella sp.]